MFGGAVTRYAVAAVGILALGVWGWQQRDRALEAEAGRAAAEMRIAGYEAAAAVHRAHIQRLERITADAVALDREFQEQEGADAPLDDYLRDGAGRVWR